VGKIASQAPPRPPQVRAVLPTRSRRRYTDAGLENQADACDLVLRFGLPNDPGMIARKIAMTTQVLCAAGRYERAGRDPGPGMGAKMAYSSIGEL
jgi:hypothetical protein